MKVSLLSATLSEVYSSLTESDYLWVLLGICLVFFMQAGFAMVETGFTRAKNAGNIIMKNLMDFCIGTVAFLILGYVLMHGEDLGGFVGDVSSIKEIYNNFVSGDMLKVMFHLVFCATAATIVSGAMAERTNFMAYCIYSFIISLIIYPVSGHWIWGGGWLAELGFHDFAGSAAVHLVGGVAAFVGAAILGPRIGKYKKNIAVTDKKGRPTVESKAIPGHSLTLGALGVFILWFGWYGFNGSSAYAVNDSVSGIISGFIYNKELTAAQAFGYFGVQILGIIAVILWVGVLMTAVFLLLSLCRVCGIIQLLNYL